MITVEDFCGKPYKLLIGADHGGFDIKKRLIDRLRSRGVDIEDVGPHCLDLGDDYPDFAGDLAARVARGEADCGILICRTGIGMSINANRFPGVRAALADTPPKARLSRNHNCSNILVAAGDALDDDALLALVDAWLETPFSGADRHVRRLLKIERNSADNLSHVYRADEEVARWLTAGVRGQASWLNLRPDATFLSAAVRSVLGCRQLGRRGTEGAVDRLYDLTTKRLAGLFSCRAAAVLPLPCEERVDDPLLPGDVTATVLAIPDASGAAGRLLERQEVIELSEARRGTDLAVVEEVAHGHRPDIIVWRLDAWSGDAEDVAQLRQLANGVGAVLVTDLGNAAGLAAAGVTPRPGGSADVTVGNTDATFGGPPGVFLVADQLPAALEARWRRLAQAALPTSLAAMAVALQEAKTDAFRARAQRAAADAAALEAALAGGGISAGGCGGSHRVQVDLQSLNLDAETALRRLADAGLSAGAADDQTLALGTMELAARGMDDDAMAALAGWLRRCLTADDGAAAVAGEVAAAARRFAQPI